MATKAVRQRRYRQRQANGLTVYRVSASYEVLDAIITAGRLTEEQALDKGEVERALGRIIVEWAFNYFVTHNARS